MSMTIDEAKDLFREKGEKGVCCPACNQFVKMYRRKIGSAMARGLIAMYREHGTEYGYLPDVRRKHGLQQKAESLLRYWGLIEQRDDRRPDGSDRNGWWRLTALGEEFVKGEVAVPMYARIYNSKCYGLEGEEVTIIDALGTDFDYRLMMRGL